LLCTEAGKLTLMVLVVLSSLMSIYSAKITSVSAQESDSVVCACPAIVLTPYIAYDTSSVIFSGKVVNIDEEQELVKLDILKSWKGLEQRESVTMDQSSACSYLFELNGEYLVYGNKLTMESLPDDNVYRTSVCSFTKPLGNAGHDVTVISFLSGETSVPFTVSTTLDGQEYSISGRLTDGITINEFTIHPEWGIAIGIETGRAGVIELNLPTNIISGYNYVDVVVSDYTAATDFESMSGNDTHTKVYFSVPESTRRLMITGTHVVPEFGSLSVVITALSIGTVLFMMSRSNRKAAGEIGW